MDEGLIYEEGTPQQIFDNPQKEKTRTFINRIRSYEYRISSPNFDLYELQAEMESFCEKHMISKKTSGYVVHLAEEVLTLMKDFSDIRIGLSYSEKEGTVELTCKSTGAPFNPLDESAAEDDIGIKLIKARCSAIDYQYGERENVLVMKMKT
jgi:polar amino acid transport system ATP-binding protein